MEQVDGAVSVVLNGQSIGSMTAAASRYEIEVPDLAERNVLVVEVELPDESADPVSRREAWGVIALVVRTHDSGNAAQALA